MLRTLHPEDRDSSYATLAPLAFAILIAFFFRVDGVASLSLWGDSAYSVYTATKDPTSIALERIYDGHPPLYYYLLHYWIELAGTSEFSLRMLSIYFGVLAVPLTYKLARAHLIPSDASPNGDVAPAMANITYDRTGRSAWQETRLRHRVGLLAAYLVASSPMLTYYSRQVRMYSLFPFLALLSAYALLVCLKKSREGDPLSPESFRAGSETNRLESPALSTPTGVKHRLGREGIHWIAYVLVTTAALFTHYYALLVVAAEAIYVLAFHRDVRRSFARWKASQVVIGALFLPWLAFAATTSATTTAAILSNAAAPDGLLGFAEEFWIPFNLGVTWDLSTARPVSLLLAGLLTVSAVYLFRVETGASRIEPMVWLLLIAPLAGSFLIWLAVPYAVRQRFLVFSLPSYLIILSWMLILLSRTRVLQALLTTAVIAASGFALVRAAALEPLFVETDAAQVVDHVQASARPGDALVFHAAWQIGYVKSHYKGQPPDLYSLNDLSEDRFSLLDGHPRVWLAMYQAAPRDPRYPLETWLDAHWHKAEQLALGPTRLSLYLAPKFPPVDKASIRFLLEDGQPGIELESFGLDRRQLAQGSPLAFSLRWRALTSIAKPYTVFAHLIDKDGRRWAGADSEPQSGARPTNLWHPGETVDDLRAISIPKNIPPGEYSLFIGLYDRDVRRLRIVDASGKALGDTIPIGAVQVRGLARNQLKSRHPVNGNLTPEVRLLDYEIDNDLYRPRLIGTLVGKLDVPLRLTADLKAYHPGEDIHLTTVWQATDTPKGQMRVLLRLADERGQVLAQNEYQPFEGMYSITRWTPGDILMDSYVLRIDPSIPDGEYTLQIAVRTSGGDERLGGRDDGTDAIPLAKVKVER